MNSTDHFVAAARAEARREAPHYDRETLAYGQHMAEWARTHLAAQEPTDAEVEAAARAISAEQDRRIGLKAGVWWSAERRRNLARTDARAALSAARRDEKDRP